MSTIGVVARDEKNVPRGRIATLNFSLDFWLARNPRHDADSPGSSPSLLVMAKGPRGEDVACGAAWARKAKGGPNPGSKFYTMTVDDPSLDQPLHVTLFKAGGDAGGFDVVWRRARKAPSTVAAAAEDEESAPIADDEIPF